MLKGFFLLILTALLAASCQGATKSTTPDAANATYTIEGKSVTLSKGSSEQPAAPGSATKTRTKLADRQAVGDVNRDSKSDAAVVLIQDPGGSGTFYYLAAVLDDGEAKAKATNAELLGDRIVVESVSINDGLIIVDYLIRRDNEPMTAAPSVKATKRFALKDGKLSELR